MIATWDLYKSRLSLGVLEIDIPFDSRTRIYPFGWLRSIEGAQAVWIMSEFQKVGGQDMELTRSR